MIPEIVLLLSTTSDFNSLVCCDNLRKSFEQFLQSIIQFSPCGINTNFQFFFFFFDAIKSQKDMNISNKQTY